MSAKRALIVALCTMAAPAPAVARDAWMTDDWQRIDLQSPPVKAAHVRILIHTDGPHMSGLVRIPGAFASNFETSGGAAFVDLINRSGAEITSVEIAFTEHQPGQLFTVAPIGYDP